MPQTFSILDIANDIYPVYTKNLQIAEGQLVAVIPDYSNFDGINDLLNEIGIRDPESYLMKGNDLFIVFDNIPQMAIPYQILEGIGDEFCIYCDGQDVTKDVSLKLELYLSEIDNEVEDDEIEETDG
jgi:hypothetical protein